MPELEVLGGGRAYSVALDEEDFAWASLCPPRWYCRSARDSRKRFVFRPVKMIRACDGSKTSRFQYLARVILRARAGFAVTYRDGDPLNLRRSNLRLVETAELPRLSAKSRRRRGGRRDTPFYGVYHLGRSGRWQASLRVSGKLLHLGVFETPEEAAVVYDAAVRSHGLDRRRLNFAVPVEVETCRIEIER